MDMRLFEVIIIPLKGDIQLFHCENLSASFQGELQILLGVGGHLIHALGYLPKMRNAPVPGLGMRGHGLECVKQVAGGESYIMCSLIISIMLQPPGGLWAVPGTRSR